MFSLKNTFIKYGDRILMDHINLRVEKNDRIGLIGINGAGKSTILKLVAGRQKPDEGTLEFDGKVSVGYLEQDLTMDEGQTVLEAAKSAFTEVQKVIDRIEFLTQELTTRTDYESDSYSKLIEEQVDLNDRFAHLGGATVEADIEKVLLGLGFKSSDLNRDLSEFSGGWQMRVELAKLLLQKPDLLLLDEPTNHLDMESIIWLENYVNNQPLTLLIISHDTHFLDAVTNKTIEIERGKILEYKASYKKYVILRKERIEMQQAAFKNQQKDIAQKERTISRFMAKANKTKMAQSMQKQLDKVERIEIENVDTSTMKLQFMDVPRSGRTSVHARLSKNYGDLQVLRDIDLMVERGQRVAFVGQNGQGKSTLAKIIVGDLKASSGGAELGHNVEIAYYAQNQAENLDPKKTLLETMEEASPPEMRTKLRNILGSFRFSGDDVEKKVSVLSGGERARLALACMILRPFNLLVLDEPTNHLDIYSKEILKQALMDYSGTLLVVSHDRDFLKGLTEQVVEFRDQKLKTYLGDIEYFLGQRSIQDIRTLELEKKKKNQAKEKAAIPQNGEERKKWEKKVKYCERDIDRLEDKIKEEEVSMGEEGFYEREDSAAIIEKYQALKNELKQKMQEWEDAAEKLDQFA